LPAKDPLQKRKHLESHKLLLHSNPKVPLPADVPVGGSVGFLSLLLYSARVVSRHVCHYVSVRDCAESDDMHLPCEFHISVRDYILSFWDNDGSNDVHVQMGFYNLRYYVLSDWDDDGSHDVHLWVSRVRDDFLSVWDDDESDDVCVPIWFYIVRDHLPVWNDYESFHMHLPRGLNCNVRSAVVSGRDDVGHDLVRLPVLGTALPILTWSLVGSFRSVLRPRVLCCAVLCCVSELV